MNTAEGTNNKEGTENKSKETNLEIELKKVFPNLSIGIGDDFLFPIPPRKVATACESLLILAELSNLQNRVLRIDIAGSTPEMSINRGLKNPQDPNSGRKIGKIYQKIDTKGIWAEGWNPEEVGLKLEHEGDTGPEYFIKF